MANAIAAAVTKSGVPHVAMLSAIAAVLPDGNGPAKDLHYCENRLRACGTTLTALRACYFQDNVASVLTPAKQAGIYPNFLPSSDVAFPMIATRDIGRLAASALVSPPPTSEVVDLFGPTYSVRQVAEYLGAALGKTLEIVNIPPEGHVTALMKAGVPQQIAEAVAEMFAAFSAGLLVPRGDRSLSGGTTIDLVIAECLRHYQAAGVDCPDLASVAGSRGQDPAPVCRTSGAVLGPQRRTCANANTRMRIRCIASTWASSEPTSARRTPEPSRYAPAPGSRRCLPERVPSTRAPHVPSLRPASARCVHAR